MIRVEWSNIPWRLGGEVKSRSRGINMRTRAWDKHRSKRSYGCIGQHGTAQHAWVWVWNCITDMWSADHGCGVIRTRSGEGLKDTWSYVLSKHHHSTVHIHSKHHHSTSGRSRICEFRNYGCGVIFAKLHCRNSVTGNRYRKYLDEFWKFMSIYQYLCTCLCSFIKRMLDTVLNFVTDE
jgi:hypothetical protein